MNLETSPATSAVDDETEAVIRHARAEMALRAIRAAALAAVSFTMIVVSSMLIDRATSWKAELIHTGARTDATVTNVHRAGIRRGDHDAVTISYESTLGTQTPVFNSIDDLSRYRQGQLVTVFYDPANPHHVRTQWDAAEDPAEIGGAAFITLALFVLLPSLISLRQALIGLRIGWMATWTVGRVRLRRESAGRNGTRLVFGPTEDRSKGPFCYRPLVVHRRLPKNGTYTVRFAERGFRRLLAIDGSVVLAHRARLDRTRRRWRRVLGPPFTEALRPSGRRDRR